MRVLLLTGACLLALSTTGCSCSQRHTAGDDHDGGAADAAPDGRADGPRTDGPGPRDATLPWDAGTCEQPWYWERSVRPVFGVSLANGAPPRVGVTEQLLVQVQLLSGSCEALAGVEAALMPGDATDFVELTAYVWTVAGTVPCTPDAPIVSTVVVIPGRGQGNTRVVVSDASSPDGQFLLTYQRTYCAGLPDCQCYPGSPAGPGHEYADCLTDCSCADGLACIGAVGLVGAGWSCMRPCVDDRDCGAGAFCARYVADAAAWVCWEGSQCQTTGDCPAGFVCALDAAGAGSCVDQRPVPTKQACTCDAECPPGQSCSLVWGNQPTCEVWCQDAPDCPAAGQGWLVCGTPEVCVPLE
jgi:hypothetical protein